METPSPSRVRDTRQIARNIWLLRLDNVLSAIPQPGQFIMVWNGSDEKPMAVCKVEGDHLLIAVKSVGPFTKALSTSKTGDLLGIRGPYGRPFDCSFQRPLLAAGGIGASPLLHLAGALASRGLAPVIVLGFNSQEDVVFSEEFSVLGKTTICTVDGSLGRPGMLTQNLPQFEAFDCVYACGPEPMIAKVGRMAEEAHRECQLLVERYFKCGLGLCGSCALGRHVVCRDGPVFRWSELRGTEFGVHKLDSCGMRTPIARGT